MLSKFLNKSRRNDRRSSSRKSQTSRNSYYNSPSNSRESIVGRAAPAIEVKTIEDAERIVKLFGEFASILGIIYAKWCGHCTRMMPQYNQLVKSKKNASPSFVVEESNLETLNNVLKNNGMKPLSAEAYPTVRSYGPNASVVKEMPPDIKVIEAALQAPAIRNSAQAMSMGAVSQGVATPPSTQIDDRVAPPPQRPAPLSIGGSLMGAAASTAYHLAPAAVLLATAAVTLKRCHRKRGRKTRRGRKTQRA
jgi:thiol-disulfide isomerase/thioredoxin